MKSVRETAGYDECRKAIRKARLKKPVEEAAPTTKICPFCKSEINIEATKCAFCGSGIEMDAQ